MRPVLSQTNAANEPVATEHRRAASPSIERQRSGYTLTSPASMC